MLGTTSLRLVDLGDQETKDVTLKFKLRCRSFIVSIALSSIILISFLPFRPSSLSPSLGIRVWRSSRWATSIHISVASFLCRFLDHYPHLSLPLCAPLYPSVPSPSRHPSGDMKQCEAQLAVSCLFQYSKVDPIRKRVAAVQERLRAVEKELASLKAGKDMDDPSSLV